MSDETTDERPSWLYVGAELVTFTPQQWKEGGTIRKVVVTKIGKRDVVLDDGQRFNIDRLERTNGSWSPSTYLLPRDDERITRALYENKKQRLFSDAAAAWDFFAKARDGETARAVSDAVAAYLSHANESSAT